MLEVFAWDLAALDNDPKCLLAALPQATSGSPSPQALTWTPHMGPHCPRL